MIPLLGKNITELSDIAVENGMKPFVGKQLAHWLYVKRVISIDEMTNLPQQGRVELKKKYTVGRYQPTAKAVSNDGTCKYLFEIKNEFTDKKPTYIETVFLPEEDRATLCVSTQAGCRMGCRFCMTGTLGFQTHLRASDILNQIFTIDSLHGNCLTNIVYMGEGEPLDNIDEVLRSIEVLTADYGCGWSPHRITVSTVGFLPGLQKFLEESDCHLAISLHNPFRDERAALMPAEKAYPMADVLTQLHNYIQKETTANRDFRRQRRLSFEYICFGGQNDTPRHARALARLLNNLPCRVNLIRFHTDKRTTENNASNKIIYPPSNPDAMIYLRDYLTQHGITTTIRRSRGEDILAACGMLVNALA